MNLSLQRTGSKVNGLEQPFHTWSIYCLLFNIPSGMGGGQGEGWNGGELSMVHFKETC